MTGAPFTHPCDVAGCDAWGAFGFAWRGRIRWACAAHRARGRDWLARIKAAEQPKADPGPEPAQGSLL